MEKFWYKEAIIYEVHVKCFYDSSGDGIGDFRGLTEKLDYLQDLGVTAIWLLPFYPSPLKDDGYDIADYTDIHPHYGDLKDFREFLKEAHKRGLRVITELVINHTSDQHPWFQKARHAPEGSPERDFYVWSPTQEKYQETRIIFQDFEASNWSWDREAHSYYWHRFYSHQPDLNFDNPEVHKAIFSKMSFWLKLGVDGMRLDAIPYLYEREGTNCENLPETHEFLKKLRARVDEHFSDRMLLAEANQWPEEAAQYFGDGDECHMAFHFPVMPRLFMAIHLEDSLPIIEIMEQTPKIPENAQWALFLRNHDELTLEMVTDEERDYMFRVYAFDPQARINLGIRRRLAPLLKNDRRKIELMNVLLFSLSGTPVLYYGDEIGMGDNIYLGDRNGVRTPMQWSNDRNAGFSRANPQQLYLPPIIDPEYHYETVNVEAQQNNPYSLLWWTKQLIALRKRYTALSYGTTEFIAIENRKILVFLRSDGEEQILIIANLSRFPQYTELDLKKFAGYHLIEMFSGEQFPSIGELPYFLTLGPYGYYWFSLEKRAEESGNKLLNRSRERQIHTLFLKEPERLFHSSQRRELTECVKKYLAKRSWFQSYLLLLDKTKTRIVDRIVLQNNGGAKRNIILVKIVLTTGAVHFLPLFLSIFEGETAMGKLEFSPENVVTSIQGGKQPALLFDVGSEPDVAEEIMKLIQNQQKLRSERGELEGIKLNHLDEKTESFRFPGKEHEWVAREEKEIIFPTLTGVLRLFADIEEGVPVDVEMRLFLMRKTDFEGFIPMQGYLEYHGPDKTVLALAESTFAYRKEYNARQHAYAAADHFLVRMESVSEPPPQEVLIPDKTLLEMALGPLDPDLHRLLEGHPEVVHLLGHTTSDFHLAMSSLSFDTQFAPTPFTLFYQRSLYQTIRRKVRLCFARLESIQSALEPTLKREVEELLQKQEMLKEILSLLPYYKFHAVRTRYHGNYVLENLHYTGKEFLIANFEGNPLHSYSEKRYKRSPLLDVASMLYSFSDVSFEAVEKLTARGLMFEKNKDQAKKWAHVWSLWMGSSFLRAYLHKMKESEILPDKEQEIDFLLGVFLIERCVEAVINPETKRLEAPIWTLLHWLPIYERYKKRFS